MSNLHLIDDTELNPGPGESQERSTDTEAVSRRPTDLLSKAELERFSERTDTHGLAYFFTHYALIIAGCWLTWETRDSAFLWPVLLIHSVVVGFLFSPLHECSHGAAFKTRWLNEIVLWITAFVYLVPPNYFRYFHLGHHRYTQVPGKDPSLVLPEPANLKQYLWYCAGLWFWWRNLSWMIKHAAGRVHPSSADYVPRGRRRMMVSEARWLTVLYTVLGVVGFAYGFADVLVLCWLTPRFLGEPVQRVLRVAEHVGCQESTNLLRNTRTTLSNPMVNAIAWQMPFHAAHHLFPNVPFHRLPDLHWSISDRVVVEPNGYLAGQWKILRWLRTDNWMASRRHRVSTPML